MSHPVMIGDKSYDQIKVLKKALGPSASYNTVISELLKQGAGSMVKEKVLISMIHEKLQRLEVYTMIRNLQDLDIYNDQVPMDEVMLVTMLVLNNQWNTLHDITSARAAAMDKALDNYDKNKELISEWKKPKNMMESDQSLLDSGALTVKPGTTSKSTEDTECAHVVHELQKNKPKSQKKKPKNVKKPKK